ncbi:MAG: glycosyltransferase family 4 protein [Armatimonadota bacterium]
MKIAMLGVKSVPCPGGIATYTEQVGSRLATRGHDVTVYCRRQYLREADDIPPAPYRGIERRLSPGIRGKYFDALTHTLSAAIDACGRDCDIINIHGSAPAAAVAPMLRLRRRCPVVVTIHSLDWEGAKWGGVATGAMRAAARIPVRFADEVTVVSKRLQNYYRDTFGRETTYIASGAAPADLRPPDEIRERWGLSKHGYILFVGRLTPEKGLEYLIEAYRRIETDMPLVLVGGANYEDPYVEALVRQADDRIIFTGYQSGATLSELFTNAYLYVQPSTLEGLSMAVVEALSYGRFVLASDIPGNVEALGECGRTFTTADVDDLESALAELLHSPAEVREQFEIARGRVAREYDWDRTADGFETVFEHACGASGEETETFTVEADAAQ